jgi:nucleotide-binding universal stress UspA family protein
MAERTQGPDKGRIVVGVDGSQASMDAIRWAAAQAQTTGAALEAVLTWDLPMDAYAPMPASYDVRSQSEQELCEIVQDIQDEFSGIDVSSTVIEGSAGRALVAAANGAELLVVGSRGHGAVVGILLGSVSEYCITHAGCPVVVVRHDKEGTSHKQGPVGSTARQP